MAGEHLRELLLDVMGADRAGDVGAEAETGVLVDDVEDLQRAAIGSAIADEVVAPDLVSMRGGSARIPLMRPG